MTAFGETNRGVMNARDANPDLATDETPDDHEARIFRALPCGQKDRYKRSDF